MTRSFNIAVARLTDLLLHVDKASDDVIMMSRMNCHCRGADSIVVQKHSGGNLTRVFLAWPGNDLLNNVEDGRYTVGVHNHRYPIRISLVCGDVTNILYDRVPRLGKFSVHLYHHEFRSGGMSSPPEVRLLGVEQLYLSRWKALNFEEAEYLVESDLHTMRCGPFSAWKVEEGANVRDATDLFSPDETIRTEELYTPFESPDAVRKRVREFVNGFFKDA